MRLFRRWTSRLGTGVKSKERLQGEGNLNLGFSTTCLRVTNPIIVLGKLIGEKRFAVTPRRGRKKEGRKERERENFSYSRTDHLRDFYDRAGLPFGDADLTENPTRKSREERRHRFLSRSISVCVVTFAS